MEMSVPVHIKFPGSMVCLFGLMQQAARAHGYALACHGSMNRDFDLIAVPWIEKPGSSSDVAHAIAKSVGAHIPSFITVPDNGVNQVRENPVKKPHGRDSWVIPLGGGPYLDLSVIRPRSTLTEIAREALGHNETTLCLPGEAENEGQ
jgi:hypothetical protein